MKMKSLVAAGMLATTLPLAPALAQEKQPLTPGIVEQLNLASKLTNYGLEREDPFLLLAAARLLSTIDPAAAASQEPISAEELIAKAREMSGDRQSVNLVADDVEEEVSRGLCYGPGTVYGCF